MADKKVIAVVGATGAQGGGLARAILADRNGGFACAPSRAIRTRTRRKALADAGAEVVTRRSRRRREPEEGVRGRARRLLRHQLLGALLGREGEGAGQEHRRRGEGRRRQARHLVDARGHAQADGPADDKRMPMLQEKYRVPHFDAKAEADAYFAGLPVTYLVTSFYWDNLYMFGLGPKKGDDGVYGWAFPMGQKRLAGIAAEDIGKVAYGIFKAGSKYIGKTVGIAGENLTVDEMSEKLAKGLGIAGQVQRRRSRCLPRLRLSRAPTRWATCSRSIATSRRKCSRRATSSSHDR